MTRFLRKLFIVQLTAVFFLAQCVVAPSSRAASSWRERVPTGEAFSSSVPAELAGLVDVQTASLASRLRPSDRSAFSASPSSNVKALPPSLAALPPSLGGVARAAAADPGAPWVVLIEDAHHVLSAQRSIRGVLEALQPADGAPFFVGMEGCSGPFDVPAFRRFRNQDLQREVAEALFDQNLITGAEAFGLISAREPLLWGVDDDRLYMANVEAYREGLLPARQARTALAALRAALAADKEKTFSPALREFDRRVAAYETGRDSLSGFLREALRAAGPRAARFPEAVRFIAAVDLERTVDFVRLEAQRARLTGVLSRALDAASLERLAASGRAYRSGAVGAARYYGVLREAMARAGVSPADLPDVDAYARCAVASEAISAARLTDELEGLKESVARWIAARPAEEALLARQRDLSLAAGLLDHGLGAAQWDLYLKRGEAVRALAAGPGGPGFDAAAFAAALDAGERFYRAADARNRAMARNLLEGLRKSSAPGALPMGAMVAGGFHSEGLERELRALGVSVAVVTPHFLGADGAGDALSALSGRRTPLQRTLLGERLTANPTPAFASETPDATMAGTAAPKLAARLCYAVGSPDPAAAAAEAGFPSAEIVSERGESREVRVRVDAFREMSAVATRESPDGDGSLHDAAVARASGGMAGEPFRLALKSGLRLSVGPAAPGAAARARASFRGLFSARFSWPGLQTFFRSIAASSPLQDFLEAFGPLGRRVRAGAMSSFSGVSILARGAERVLDAARLDAPRFLHRALARLKRWGALALAGAALATLAAACAPAGGEEEVGGPLRQPVPKVSQDVMPRPAPSTVWTAAVDLALRMGPNEQHRLRLPDGRWIDVYDNYSDVDEKYRLNEKEMKVLKDSVPKLLPALLATDVERIVVLPGWVDPGYTARAGSRTVYLYVYVQDAVGGSVRVSSLEDHLARLIAHEWVHRLTWDGLEERWQELFERAKGAGYLRPYAWTDVLEFRSVLAEQIVQGTGRAFRKAFEAAAGGDDTHLEALLFFSHHLLVLEGETLRAQVYDPIWSDRLHPRLWAASGGADKDRVSLGPVTLLLKDGLVNQAELSVPGRAEPLSHEFSSPLQFPIAKRVELKLAQDAVSIEPRADVLGPDGSWGLFWVPDGADPYKARLEVRPVDGAGVSGGLLNAVDVPAAGDVRVSSNEDGSMSVSVGDFDDAALPAVYRVDRERVEKVEAADRPPAAAAKEASGGGRVTLSGTSPDGSWRVRIREDGGAFILEVLSTEGASRGEVSLGEKATAFSFSTDGMLAEVELADGSRAYVDKDGVMASVRAESGDKSWRILSWPPKDPGGPFTAELRAGWKVERLWAVTDAVWLGYVKIWPGDKAAFMFLERAGGRSETVVLNAEGRAAAILPESGEGTRFYVLPDPKFKGASLVGVFDDDPERAGAGAPLALSSSDRVLSFEREADGRPALTVLASKVAAGTAYARLYADQSFQVRREPHFPEPPQTEPWTDLLQGGPFSTAQDPNAGPFGWNLVQRYARFGTRGEWSAGFGRDPVTGNVLAVVAGPLAEAEAAGAAVSLSGPGGKFAEGLSGRHAPDGAGYHTDGKYGYYLFSFALTDAQRANLAAGNVGYDLRLIPVDAATGQPVPGGERYDLPPSGPDRPDRPLKAPAAGGLVLMGGAGFRKLRAFLNGLRPPRAGGAPAAERLKENLSQLRLLALEGPPAPRPVGQREAREALWSLFTENLRLASPDEARRLRGALLSLRQEPLLLMTALGSLMRAHPDFRSLGLLRDLADALLPSAGRREATSLAARLAVMRDAAAGWVEAKDFKTPGRAHIESRGGEGDPRFWARAAEAAGFGEDAAPVPARLATSLTGKELSAALDRAAAALPGPASRRVRAFKAALGRSVFPVAAEGSRPLSPLAVLEGEGVRPEDLKGLLILAANPALVDLKGLDALKALVRFIVWTLDGRALEAPLSGLEGALRSGRAVGAAA